jgi:flagellar protein FliO/FliZ
LGGEKLKAFRGEFRPFWGLFLAGFLILTGFLGNTLTLSAQTNDPQAAERAAATDESSLVLGEAPAAPAASGGSSVFVMIRMVLVLALAALALYGVVFFIKRLAKPQENKDPHLKVLARVSLGNDSFATVVSLRDKAWLLAGGSGGVNLVSEIIDAESLETLLLEDARREAEAGNRRFMDFGSLLSRLGGSGGRRSRQLPNAQRYANASQPEPDGAEDSGSLSENGSLAESLRRQRDRLKGL